MEKKWCPYRQALATKVGEEMMCIGERCMAFDSGECRAMFKAIRIVSTNYFDPRKAVETHGL